MNFDLKKSIEILERTPLVIEKMLGGLSDEWITSNEGENTWWPFDIVGHLIHGEKTDWIPRMEIILSNNPDKKFEPFNRFAQYTDSKGKSLNDLLAEFKMLRAKNIHTLKSKSYSRDIFLMKGIHPALGKVTLKQLLATWVVHDLNHIAQISRVMAKQYKEEVGPWKEYLPVLNK